MNYIVTVHSDRTWIKIQQRQFKLFFNGEEFKVIATVPDPGNCGFDEEWPDQSIANATSISHQRNLNFLMPKVLEKASDDDVMIVIDGDAFPIAPFKSILGKFELVGIERTRNKKRIIHVSFIAVRVGLWKRIKAFWGPGRGLNDTSGNINRCIAIHNIKWKCLKRTNRTEILYPPCFGVYDDWIYHHGSGFRPIGHILPYERMVVRALWGKDKYNEGVEEFCKYKATVWDLMYQRIKESPNFYKLMI